MGTTPKEIEKHCSNCLYGWKSEGVCPPGDPVCTHSSGLHKWQPLPKPEPEEPVAADLPYKDRLKLWLKEHDLKVGDKVRIVRKAESHENGWHNSWASKMSEAVGAIGTLRDVGIDSLGLSVYCDKIGTWSYPYFVLEPVKEADEAPQQRDEGARKYDTGKPQYSLIPTEALDGLARLYTQGAEKYDARNWEKGMDFSRLYDALQRHVQKWWSGQDYDQDDGQHHLLSVIWCAMALYTYQVRYMDSFDNRPEGAGHLDGTAAAFWCDVTLPQQFDRDTEARR